MAGGLGNDTYVVDVASDVVTEAVGAGIDTVRTGLRLHPGQQRRESGADRHGAINGTGNVLDNVLLGKAPPTC